MSDWGQGAKNNNIGWGQGAVNNDISWGASHKISWAGDTEIVGTDGNVPVNTVAPVISGTALVGNTLTSTTGTWTSDTGVTGYLYQWTRDDVNISGATNSTYTLVSADLNTSIICKVAATDIDGTSAYVNSNSLVVYDSDYKAVLDYATTLGYTLPSVSQRLKQSILLSSLKTAGIWSKLDTFANFATDGSSNFALIDWKNLSLYTAVNSPTFTTNVGFATNGTSSYINTNKITGANFTLNSASEFKWINNPLNTSAVDATSGARSTDGLGNLYEINDGNCFVNSSSATAFLLNTSAGFRHINRSNNTQVERIVNGVSVVRNQASTSVVNRIPFIGCINTGIASAFESNSFSIYGFGGNLSTEAVNFYNAINTYRNSL